LAESDYIATPFSGKVAFLRLSISTQAFGTCYPGTLANLTLKQSFGLLSSDYWDSLLQIKCGKFSPPHSLGQFNGLSEPNFCSTQHRATCKVHAGSPVDQIQSTDAPLEEGDSDVASVPEEPSRTATNYTQRGPF